MSNPCSFISETVPQYCYYFIKMWVKDQTLITVIMQIRTFSLNLDTSNKIFKTTKYSLERSYQK